MSILTKEERARIRKRITNFDSAIIISKKDVAAALDTIDALEARLNNSWALLENAHRDLAAIKAERDELEAERDKIGRDLDDQEDLTDRHITAMDADMKKILTIRDIAEANHDTRVIGGAHAALREILAVIEDEEGER